MHPLQTSPPGWYLFRLGPDAVAEAGRWDGKEFTPSGATNPLPAEQLARCQDFRRLVPEQQPEFPKVEEDTSDCPFCDRETRQRFTASHERDSTYDLRECLECGAAQHGHGEWEQAPIILYGETCHFIENAESRLPGWSIWTRKQWSGGYCLRLNGHWGGDRIDNAAVFPNRTRAEAFARELAGKVPRLIAGREYLIVHSKQLAAWIIQEVCDEDTPCSLTKAGEWSPILHDTWPCRKEAEEFIQSR